ncbi:DUF6485 family protein [Peptococcaceae bacterium]|nr:DUF6485 family protein [Peptococcaceae bacterium]
MQCKKDENLKMCICTYEYCNKKGLCCECVAYHRQRGEIPGCFFSADAERTYDRSLKFFIKSISK